MLTTQHHHVVCYQHHHHEINMKNENNVNIVHHYGNDESYNAEEQKPLGNKTEKDKIETIHRTFITLRVRRKGSNVVRYTDDIQNILDGVDNE